jgi:hypothetical protein
MQVQCRNLRFDTMLRHTQHPLLCSVEDMECLEFPLINQINSSLIPFLKINVCNMTYKFMQLSLTSRIINVDYFSNLETSKHTEHKINITFNHIINIVNKKVVNWVYPEWFVLRGVYPPTQVQFPQVTC